MVRLGGLFSKVTRIDMGRAVAAAERVRHAPVYGGADLMEALGEAGSVFGFYRPTQYLISAFRGGDISADELGHLLKEEAPAAIRHTVTTLGTRMEVPLRELLALRGQTPVGIQALADLGDRYQRGREERHATIIGPLGGAVVFSGGGVGLVLYGSDIWDPSLAIFPMTAPYLSTSGIQGGVTANRFHPIAGLIPRDWSAAEGFSNRFKRSGLPGLHNRGLEVSYGYDGNTSVIRMEPSSRTFQVELAAREKLDGRTLESVAVSTIDYGSVPGRRRQRGQAVVYDPRSQAADFSDWLLDEYRTSAPEVAPADLVARQPFNVAGWRSSTQRPSPPEGFTTATGRRAFLFFPGKVWTIRGYPGGLERFPYQEVAQAVKAAKDGRTDLVPRDVYVNLEPTASIGSAEWVFVSGDISVSSMPVSATSLQTAMQLVRERLQTDHAAQTGRPVATPTPLHGVPVLLTSVSARRVTRGGATRSSSRLFDTGAVTKWMADLKLHLPE